MEYQISGGNFPVLICNLQAGEGMRCQSGAMTWMDPSVRIDRKSVV